MKLKEIAAQTGVSPSAVSLVMHGRPGVGAAKREQIMRLLEENGYAADKPRLRPEDVLRTENTARAIRLLKCKRHAMLVDGNPGFISMIIDAISLECRRQGYELLVTTCSAADLPEIMRAVHAEQCGGVLLLGTEAGLPAAGLPPAGRSRWWIPNPRGSPMRRRLPCRTA